LRLPPANGWASEMTAALGNNPSSAAQALGYAGLLPFVGLALASYLVVPEQQTELLSALRGYGATILSFLGAIHWGLTLRDATPSTRLLLWGVLPSLLAWVALLLPMASGLWLLAAGLWACWAVDRQLYPRLGLSGWLPMRLVLTVLASLSCVAGALALAP
jgi:hypothetical protein